MEYSRQTRPVYVETLVLKATIEEQMLHRRTKMTHQEHENAEKSLLDDEPMSDIIKSVALLPLPEDNQCDSLVDIAPLHESIKLFDNLEVDNGLDPENPYADLIFPIETSKTKKLGIRKSSDTELHQVLNYSLGPSDRKKRKDPTALVDTDTDPGVKSVDTSCQMPARPAKKRVAFALDS